MIELDELKELLKDPEFRFMIRNSIINAIDQPKTSPKDDLREMLNKIKGTGYSIKDMPSLTDGFNMMNLIFENKEILGDLISDLDTRYIEYYSKTMTTLISELEN